VVSERSYSARGLKRERGLVGAGCQIGGSAAALLLALAWSSDAAAQAGGPPTIPTSGGRELNLDLRARAQYDSNVARGSHALADATGVRPDDIRYNATVAVDGSLPIGRQSVFLEGSFGYDFYQYNKSLKRERINVLGGTSFGLGPCRGSLVADYHRSIAEDEALTLLDSRNSTQDRTSFSATEACPLVGNLGETVAVTHSEIKNSGARTLIGSQTDSVNGSLSYGTPSLGSASLTASYSKVDYDQAPTALPSTAPSVEITSVGLQYQRPIGTRLTGRAAIARYDLRRDGGNGITAPLTGTNTQGTSWNVGLDYVASSRLRARASYASNIGATSRIGSAYQKRQIAEIGANYKLSPRLNASLSALRSDRQFPGTEGAVLAVASKEQRTTFTGDLSLDVGRRGHLTLNARHEQVHTDISLLDYKAYRIGLTASVSF
jgi:hypothetical protein